MCQKLKLDVLFSKMNIKIMFNVKRSTGMKPYIISKNILPLLDKQYAYKLYSINNNDDNMKGNNNNNDSTVKYDNNGSSNDSNHDSNQDITIIIMIVTTNTIKKLLNY